MQAALAQLVDAGTERVEILVSFYVYGEEDVMGQVVGFQDGDAGQRLLERIVMTGAIVCEASSGPEVTYRVLGRIPLTVRVPVSARLSEDRLTEVARRVAKSLVQEPSDSCSGAQSRAFSDAD